MDWERIDPSSTHGGLSRHDRARAGGGPRPAGSAKPPITASRAATERRRAVHGDNGLVGIARATRRRKMSKAGSRWRLQPPGRGTPRARHRQAVDDPRRLWNECMRTQWHGRRGAGFHAISALDIAIWDLFRVRAIPVSRRSAAPFTPSPPLATIYPLRTSPPAYPADAPFARAGFPSLKICVEPW